MAIQLQMLNQVDSRVKYLYLTNKTGAYLVDTNEGGFGSPNPDLASSALVAVIIRKAMAGDQMLEPVGAAYYYNPLAANDEETMFQFDYIADGTHNAYLFRLSVSLDNGVTNIDGDTLQDGDHFFMASDNKVYVKNGSANVEVTDYSELIDDTGLVNLKCELIWQAQQKVKRAASYLKYRQNRTSPATDNPLFMEAVEMREDIQGAQWAFVGGLTTEAQSIVEENLDWHNV